MWASPWMAGYYSNAIQRDYNIPAAMRAGLGKIGWHAFRHTYRAWLDATKAPMTVQKDLMRHVDIKTTMNVYGGSMPEALREANRQSRQDGNSVRIPVLDCSWTVNVSKLLKTWRRDRDSNSR